MLAVSLNIQVEGESIYGPGVRLGWCPDIKKDEKVEFRKEIETRSLK
jgi:hypothetical protein